MGLLVVDFVMKVVHVVCVFFGIKFMGSVEDEPFTHFKHGTKSVEVGLERQFEVIDVDDSSLSELLDFRQLPKLGKHINKYELMRS